MKTTDFLSPLWLLAAQPHVVRAYWRMACSVSQTGRVDPILAPGAVSGHVHNMAGGINVNPSSTHDSLLQSSCGTCEIQDDKSAYWTPKLYYQHSNGTAQEVPNGGSTVYYIGRAGNSSNPAVPMPHGFRMISGNSLLRSYDTQDVTYLSKRPIADRVSFRCITEANDLAEQPYMFRTDCKNGLRAQINFPACWDGQNLYLDNSAHVAYLSDINNGVCPPTHPVPIPLLFMEVLYGTNDVDQSSGGQFAFANGDTTGYGFHGDFLNGWNMNTFTNAVQNCLYTDNNGVATACPALAPSHTYDFPRICPEAPPVWNEPVHGLLPGGLPGCNPLTSGPAPAPQIVCPLNSSTPATANSTSSSPASSSGSSSTNTPTFSNSTTSSTTSLFSSPTFSTPGTQSRGGVFATNGTAGPTSSSTVNPTSSSTSSLSNSSSTTTSPATSSDAPDSTSTAECSGFKSVYITQTSFVTVSSRPTSASAALISSPASTTTTSSAIADSTLFLSNNSSVVCSFYSNISISGCPPPSSTVGAGARTNSAVATATGARKLRIRGRPVA